MMSECRKVRPKTHHGEHLLQVTGSQIQFAFSISSRRVTHVGIVPQTGRADLHW